MKIENHRLVEYQGKAVPFRESPNHGSTLSPRFLVMHYTAGRSADSSAGWLCDPRAKAAAHLVIDKSGAIIQLVPFNVVAWHAGASSWNDGGTSLVGMNKYSIGIELDNPGRLTRQGQGKWRALALGLEYPDSEVIEATHKHETHPSGWHMYPQVQLDVAFDVAALLFEAYQLKDIVGHDDIAPGRKSDPGPAFPMESFRGRLLGRAEDEPTDAPQFTASTALNIRVGPGTQHKTLIDTPLPTGTRVAVLESDGGWRRVDVLGVVGGVNDLQGWVNGRFLVPAPPA